MNQIQRLINATKDDPKFNENMRKFLQFSIIRRHLEELPAPFLCDSRAVLQVGRGIVHVSHILRQGASAKAIEYLKPPTLTPLPHFWSEYKKNGTQYLQEVQ